MIDEGLRDQLRGRLRVDLAGADAGYLLRAKSGVPIRLSPQAHLILTGVAEGRTSADIALDLQLLGVDATPASVDQRATSLIERIREIEAKPHHPIGFWLKRELVGPAATNAIATPASRLFAWPFAAVAVAALALGAAAIAGAPLSIEPEVALAGYGIFLVSLAVHELGHAAAAARCGMRPGGIGVLMYLIYPAFFSDVTDTWRLPRPHRVLVDLGGTYFQGLFAAALVGLACIWPAPALHFAVALIGLSILLSLNPFMRFDGYWVFIDALGLPSVTAARRTVLHALLASAKGARAEARWPRSTFVAVVIYLVALPFVWAYFLIAVGPLVLAQLVGYPALAVDVLTGFTDGRTTVASVLQLLVATLVSLGGLLLTYRSVLALAGLIVSARVWSHSRRVGTAT